MNADLEERMAGRTEFQAKAALEAKPVRHYIAVHPGCCHFDLARAFGQKQATNSIQWLAKRGMIRIEGKPQQFYVVPL